MASSYTGKMFGFGLFDMRKEEKKTTFTSSPSTLKKGERGPKKNITKEKKIKTKNSFIKMKIERWISL